MYHLNKSYLIKINIKKYTAKDLKKFKKKYIEKNIKILPTEKLYNYLRLK